MGTQEADGAEISGIEIILCGKCWWPQAKCPSRSPERISHGTLERNYKPISRSYTGAFALLASQICRVASVFPELAMNPGGWHIRDVGGHHPPKNLVRFVRPEEKLSYTSPGASNVVCSILGELLETQMDLLFFATPLASRYSKGEEQQFDT